MSLVDVLLVSAGFVVGLVTCLAALDLERDLSDDVYDKPSTRHTWVFDLNAALIPSLVVLLFVVCDEPETLLIAESLDLLRLLRRRGTTRLVSVSAHSTGSFLLLLFVVLCVLVVEQLDDLLLLLTGAAQLSLPNNSWLNGLTGFAVSGLD